MSHNWHYPTEIFLAEGEIENLSSHLNTLKISNPLVIIDKFILQQKIIQKTLADNNITAQDIYSAFHSNPSDTDIKAGNQLVKNNQSDGIICIGGGSAIDTGKTIALTAYQTCKLWDLEDKADNYKKADPEKILPIIAVPTTAGTGAEVGRAAVIINSITQEKKLIFHPKILPEIVIADPKLHISMPAALTAATGMDALAHNLEAYCAPGTHPMADGIAIAAIKLIKQWLPIAVNEPGNVSARENMLCASIMGATAFQKGLGAIHSLSHPVGGLYKAHHGLLNAIFMLPVLQFNQPAIADKIRYLALCLEIPNPSSSSFCTWLKDLCLDLKIPHNLRQIGVTNDKIDLICERALQDPSTSGNPRPLTAHDFKSIFNSAYTQTLEVA